MLTRFGAVALSALAYLWVFPWFPEVNNPNENVRFYMTAAIVEEGSYAIDGLRERWGWVNDAAVHHGQAFSVKAPGTSLLGVPFYALYGWVADAAGRPFDRAEALWACRLGASTLPALVFLAWFHGWLSRRRLGGLAREAAFFSLALGSLFYAYALLFVSHTTSAACAFFALGALAEARERGRVSSGAALGIGLATAGVTFFEYPGLPVSIVLTAFAPFAIRPWPRLAPFLLGALLPTLAVMHFQWVAFENPFTPGHLFVENDAFRAAHHEGFFGATGFHEEAALRLLVDPAFGLFTGTPLFALALVGFPLLVARRETRAAGLVAFVATVLGYLAICTMNNWRGGWTVGPRYLATLAPFFAWAAAEAVDRLEDRLPTPTAVVAVGATAAGMLLSGVPSAWYPHVPPEAGRPLSELFLTLVAHDFAPYTLLHPFAMHGSLTMVPLALVALAALFQIVGVAGGGDGAQLGRLVGGLALGAGLVLAIAWPPADTHAVREVRAYVTRHWSPAGHDRAARLAAELEAYPSESLRAELAATYRAEGRDLEARRAEAAR